MPYKKPPKWLRKCKSLTSPVHVRSNISIFCYIINSDFTKKTNQLHSIIIKSYLILIGLNRSTLNAQRTTLRILIQFEIPNEIRDHRQQISPSIDNAWWSNTASIPTVQIVDVLINATIFALGELWRGERPSRKQRVGGVSVWFATHLTRLWPANDTIGDGGAEGPTPSAPEPPFRPCPLSRANASNNQPPEYS